MGRELIREAAWRGGGFGWADGRRDRTCPFALHLVPAFFSSCAPSHDLSKQATPTKHLPQPAKYHVSTAMRLQPERHFAAWLVKVHRGRKLWPSTDTARSYIGTNQHGFPFTFWVAFHIPAAPIQSTPTPAPFRNACSNRDRRQHFQPPKYCSLGAEQAHLDS